MMRLSYQEISKMIDHSLLKPSLTAGDLESGCRLAMQYQVASVCIVPWYLKKCVQRLGESDVKASTTVGFPHGGHTTLVKLAEAEQALAEGADELDAVVNISQVRSGNWSYVESELGELINLVHDHNGLIKVIFENAYLENSQKIRLCEICGQLRADWVKTSTGYGPSGATIPDLKLMREHSPEWVQVKAAGGIATLDQLLEVRDLGVTRVGASRTQQILDTLKARLHEETLQSEPPVDLDA